MRHLPSVEALIEEVQPGVISHTAALNPGQGTTFRSLSANCTRHVAHPATVSGAHLIYVSTDVLFDGQKGNYTEEDPPSPNQPLWAKQALGGGSYPCLRRRSRHRAHFPYGPAEDVPDSTSPDTGWHQWDRHARWIVGDLRAGKPVRLSTDKLRCPIWVTVLARALVELADHTDSGVLHVAGPEALSRYTFGVRLARFHGVDPAGITPALGRESSLTRPLECTLNCSLPQVLLRTPLPGVDAMLNERSSS